jgi:ornithine cyclodeaminase
MMAADVVLVGQEEVRRLLPMGDCIDLMADALAALAKGEAIMPLRTVMWLPERVGALATMPSYLSSLGATGVKVITVFPGNHGSELDAHQGAILVFEGKRGRLVAIVDATSVTAIRTAAVSGAATQVLARKDAGDLAILGSGTQARTHLEAMMLARPIRRVRVWSRNSDRAERFAKREAARHGIKVEVSATARDAVEGADLICTTTSSPEPVLLGEWLGAGAHVNAIGAVGPGGRELDGEAVRRSRLFVDRRESASNEAGEFVLARDEGVIGEGHIVAEIGEVLAGSVRGRGWDAEITLFRGVGLAVEDLAAANHVYLRAVEAGAGARIDLGGGRRPADA